MVEQTLRTSGTITQWILTSNLQRTVSHTSMTRDSWLVTSCPDFLLQAPQWHTYVGVCGHVVWCNAKDVGDGEILETYSNSASKNTSKQTFFLMGQNLCWPVLSETWLVQLVNGDMFLQNKGGFITRESHITDNFSRDVTNIDITWLCVS